jgi:LPS-assembly protein
VDRDADTGDFGDREEIIGNVRAQLNRYWSALGFAQHRLSQPEGLLSAGVGVRYKDECLQFDASFRRDYFEDRDIEPGNTIMFRLMFKNLGEITAPVFSP